MLRHYCVIFLLGILSSRYAIASHDFQNIQLLRSVEISPQLKAEFSDLPPLRVVAVDAPPLSHYDKKIKTYNGIGIDIFQFITQELGIKFEILTGRNQTVIEKIRQIEEGHADVFIPLSYSTERAKHGLFTDPYYESHYAVITHHASNISIHEPKDLDKYQVGLIEGVSLQPILESLVPSKQLHTYNPTTSTPLFEALRSGDIDIAVFNKEIFTEKRYNQEYQLYLRTAQPISLVLVDLDHFKCVNDYYGHAVGDDYLRTVANTLKKSLTRSTELIARHGGEEFALLLTNSTPEDASNLAIKINHQIANLNLPNATANPPYLTLSIGVATVVNGDPGIKEIFMHADAQLYIAKNKGRNKIRTAVLGAA